MKKNGKKYIYGTVLLLEPEQTEVYLRNCCDKMRRLNMNTVVIWPPVFYVDGKPDYSPQQRFLDISEEYSLDVIVELTGQVANLEYLPDFMYDDQFAVTNPDGTIGRMQNGLGEMNYNHPAVKKILKDFFETTVNTLKNYPSLAGWDAWNETHFKSYDAWTMKEFQKWLIGKYGEIARLNASWKKSYTQFDQVRYDPVTWASIMPDCDWEEFRTDNLASIAREWRDWIKAVDGAHPVIADNVMSNAVWSEFDRGSDDWKLGRCVDRLGISFYPKTGGRLLPDNTPWLRSMTFAGASAAGNGSFVISEMQSHYYSEIFTPERVSSEDIVQWNIEALEQGCAGNIYWKWRPFRTGFQLGGRGLTLADGSLSRRAEAVTQMGRFFADYPEISQLHPYSPTAVLYDRWNNFTVKAINNRVRHIIGDDQPLKARCGLYRMCWERNIPVTLIDVEQMKTQLVGYRVLFLPYQVAMGERDCGLIVDFVKRGGTLVCNYPCVDIDGNGTLYGNLPGGPLNEILGATQLDNIVISGMELQELKLADGAEILSEVEGYPLVFRRRIGTGQVVYAASPLWNYAFDGNETHASVILDLLEKELPAIVPVKSDVHARLCSGPDADYLFVGNYDKLPHCRIALPAGYVPETIFGYGEMYHDADVLEFTGASMEIVKLKKST